MGIIAASKEENKRFTDKIKNCITVGIKSLGKELKKIIKPEVQVEPQFCNLTTYHYINGADIYLILNEDPDKSFEGSIQVKAQGNAVRYYPWENKIESLLTEKTEEGTKLHLTIQPLELCIIVFEKQERNCPPKQLILEKEKELKKFLVSRVLAKEYDGKGLKQKDAKEIYAPLEGMQKHYPDFSGYYLYETEEELEPNKGYLLEIEDLTESVEVFVNNESIGMKLQKPFVFDLTEKVVAGKNIIRIEVATLLERKLRSEGYDIRSMSPYRPLSPTGIVGKVMLKQYRNLSYPCEKDKTL